MDEIERAKGMESWWRIPATSEKRSLYDRMPIEGENDPRIEKGDVVMKIERWYLKR